MLDLWRAPGRGSPAIPRRLSILRSLRRPPAAPADASDLADAQTLLVAERERLSMTIESLADGIVEVDRHDRVVSVNPRARELVSGVGLGVRFRDLVGMPDPLDALAGEVVVERGTRTLAVTASRLGRAGDGLVWTVRDVSERLRLERLKSEFVATASHELRSPLTSIKGFVELLNASEGLTQKQREWVEIILVSTDRLVDLTNDLLDVARVEAGRVEIHRRPTDVAEAVEEIAVLLGPRIADREQELELELEPGLPRAMVDPVRVRQVLTNLLTNAHQYTGDGGRLTVRATSTRDAVVVEVSDTGRGMTAEQVEHVFERFYRGADASAQPGTGLGLAIVRSLVDLQGGAIDVTSVPGEGTTFTIRLPRVADGGPVAAPRAALQGLRVLVLDDEPEIAALIAEGLRPFGVETTTAHDGPTALAALRSGAYDAMTLDILMPGMSGFEVLRTLRADERLRALPIVVVSVFSGREALSGEWVVPKPIDAEELADALGAAVLALREAGAPSPGD